MNSTLQFSRAALVEAIRSDLAAHGWHHCRTPLSYEAYEALCAALGPIEGLTDIRIDEARLRADRPPGSADADRPSPYRATALDLHTDRPSAATLAWYCVAQDETDGATRFLDAARLFDLLPAEDLPELASIPVRYYTKHPTGEITFATEPLLSYAGSRKRLYYAPWLVEGGLSVAQQAALDRYATLLARAAEDSSWLVRLEPGESIFIDNRRLMHGRGALAPQSRRHLVRCFIQAAGAS